MQASIAPKRVIVKRKTEMVIMDYKYGYASALSMLLKENNVVGSLNSTKPFGKNYS